MIFRKADKPKIWVRRGLTIVEFMVSLSVASVFMLSISHIFLFLQARERASKTNVTPENYLWYCEALDKLCAKEFIFDHKAHNMPIPSQKIDKKINFDGKTISELSDVIVFKTRRSPRYVVNFSQHKNISFPWLVLRGGSKLEVLMYPELGEKRKMDFYINYKIGTIFDVVDSVYLKPVYTRKYKPTKSETWNQGQHWTLTQKNFEELLEMGKRGEVSRIYFVVKHKQVANKK